MRALSPVQMYGSCKPKGEDLVMAHLGLVKRVALHLKARIPAFMELDELIQVGMIGLLEAARAYDPVKGIEFENFAHSRVRGAILDEVRRLSFLPRSAVAINKSHSEATHELGAELGRTPTQAELADYIEKVCGVRPELTDETPERLPTRVVWIGYQPALDELFPDIDFNAAAENLVQARTQYRAHASLLEEQLQDGRPFLMGGRPGLADVQAWPFTWMLRQNLPDQAAALLRAFRRCTPGKPVAQPLVRASVLSCPRPRRWLWRCRRRWTMHPPISARRA